MHSILFGLLAAACWGIHDLCVRVISQRAEILASMFVVLASGSVFIIGAAFIWGDVTNINLRATNFALASGAMFAIAGYGLYRAFALGPVKLVAPLIASYPILSLAIAALTGQPVTLYQWAAVIVIVAGVSCVAIFSAEEDKTHSELPAILWSLLSAAGFAATFALGQVAVLSGDELSLMTITRLAALLCIFGFGKATGASMCPPVRILPLLIIMGILDAVALGAVMLAGNWPRPEFASVTSSLFGLLTVVLAWLFLQEPMTRRQWASVLVTFAGIFWLGI